MTAIAVHNVWSDSYVTWRIVYFVTFLNRKLENRIMLLGCVRWFVSLYGKNIEVSDN